MKRTLPMMYLRPGNLFKDFQVKELKTEAEGGYWEDRYVDTGKHVMGALAEADSNLSERMKHRWDQKQHSLTHTLVTQGRANLKKGDLLTLEERAFLVLLVDDVGSLGISSLAYLEERNDVK